jgi:vacuolar-type H+-ATPase subunit H
VAELELLDQIARKEQELRARLMVAREQAEALVAEAARGADELRVWEAASAAAEAQAWAEHELKAARESAEEIVARAAEEARAVSANAARLGEASRLIVSVVLGQD